MVQRRRGMVEHRDQRVQKATAQEVKWRGQRMIRTASRLVLKQLPKPRQVQLTPAVAGLAEAAAKAVVLAERVGAEVKNSSLLGHFGPFSEAV